MIYLIVDLGLPQRQRDWLVLVVGALFAVPFILFSMTGGYLADRFSKRSVTIGTKWMEVGVMSFSLFALSRGSFAMEIAGVFSLSSRRPYLGPPSMACCQNSCRKKTSPGPTALLSWALTLTANLTTIASGLLAFWGHPGR